MGLEPSDPVKSENRALNLGLKPKYYAKIPFLTRSLDSQCLFPWYYYYAAALSMGSVSKAGQILSSPATVAAITPEEAVAEFKAVNPLPGQDAPPLPPHPDGGDQCPAQGNRVRSPLAPTPNPNGDPDPLPLQTFLKAARSLDKAKAKGPTGLGNGHLRLMLSTGDAIAASMARYLNALRCGGWNEHLRRLLNAGDGLPLRQGGKVRPIVIPSATLRLIGRIATRNVRGDAERYFLHGHDRARQYAVGVEQGGEMFFRRVCDTLHADPNVLFIGSDARKAFQNFDRDSVWKLVDDEFPELSAYVRMVYGVESRILLKDAGLGDPVQVLNAVGARQGDPLGTMLYALVAQPILDEVADAYPSVQIDAFADDAGFHGVVHEDVVQAYCLYRHLYSLRLRGELNDSKAVAFSLGVTEQAARAAGLPADMPWATAKLLDGTTAQGGFVLYGAPIGSGEFVRAYLAAAVSEAKAGLERLSYMESKQHKLIMLRMSFCRKVMHIQRLVPTSEHADVLRDYDDCLVAAVEDLLVGRGQFTDLAKLKVHIPAALGGLGVDSAAARADACYYSSFTSAYFRLAAIDPDWVGSLHETAAAGLHAPFAALSAARSRLCTTPGMQALLQKLSVHDRPRRAQGKIMNLKLAAQVADLLRTLPAREVTVFNASAEAPHLVSISAGGDPNLRVPNDVLTTYLAMRLSVTQIIPSPFTGAATTTSERCPACGEHHVNAHLDGSLSCGPGGTALTTPWHDDIGRVFHRVARCVGIPATLEPASVDADSNIRTDIRLSGVSTRRADVYADVITYELTQPDTYDKEAAQPGRSADRAEVVKFNKHFASVVASNRKNELKPVAVSEYGTIGPQGMELVDIIVSRAHDPTSMKTYMMRRLAVVTATHTHRRLHGRVRGHVPLRPAAERAADPGPPDLVADDVTEQTASADDAMTMEEREGVGLGAGDAALVPDDDGARRGGCAARGACAGCAGAGVGGRGACQRCGPGAAGGLSASGRAVTL